MSEVLISIQPAPGDTFCIITGRSGTPAISCWERGFYFSRWKMLCFLGQKSLGVQGWRAAAEGFLTELPASSPGSGTLWHVGAQRCHGLGDPKEGPGHRTPAFAGGKDR